MDSSQNVATDQTDGSSPSGQRAQTSNKQGYHFWLIILSLCLSLFLSALEFTAVATALPTIIIALGGHDFVWVGASYALAASAVLPMTGGLAQVFGRGPAVVPSIGLFALGSAICGAAHNFPTMIAGRTIQGLGGGAILSYSIIILADLVPLEERGLYVGIYGLTWSIAAGIGPVLGGSLASSGQWRWLFYLNLPICGISAILAARFIRLPTPPGTTREKLAAIDWIGTFLAIAATSSATFGLSQGGINFPWESPRILSPLIIGLAGLVLFMVYEALWAKFPLVPLFILNNRTSVNGYVQTFILPITVVGAVYYIPVYFQGCKDADAVKSGVLTLGLSSVAPAAIIGGIAVKVIKGYRPQIYTGWCLQVIGMSLMSSIKSETPAGVVVVFSAVYGVGAGFNYATQVFPILAPLPVSANAHALSFLSFLRTFGGVRGVTIGGTILQNGLRTRLPQAYTSQLPSGSEFAYSAISGIRDLPPDLKGEVQHAFIDSLRGVWIVMGVLSGVGLISSLGMKGLPLHTVTDEAWGMEQRGEMTISKRGDSLAALTPHANAA